MYYFYSIQHLKTKVVCLSISSQWPLAKDGFKGYNKRWLSHLRTYGSDKKNLKITVLHESHDLNVIRQWRKYYYDCWNVLDNPKFIHSKRKRSYPTNRGPNNYLYAQTSVAKKLNLRWYTDGYSKSIFVTENTQPNGYKLGRIINHRTKMSEVGKDNIRNAHNKACIDPTGRKYKSLTEAAKQHGVSKEAIHKRIKTGHWKYA